MCLHLCLRVAAVCQWVPLRGTSCGAIHDGIRVYPAWCEILQSFPSAMARTPQQRCPECGTMLRTVYVQNSAAKVKENPGLSRYPTIKSWMYCESCDAMFRRD